MFRLVLHCLNTRDFSSRPHCPAHVCSVWSYIVQIRVTLVHAHRSHYLYCVQSCELVNLACDSKLVLDRTWFGLEVCNSRCGLDSDSSCDVVSNSSFGICMQRLRQPQERKSSAEKTICMARTSHVKNLTFLVSVLCRCCRSSISVILGLVALKCF